MTTRKSSLRRNRAATGNTARLGDGRIRRTASRGPCDDGPPRWPGRHESASSAGSRGLANVGGCSAGRCAYPCSRLNFSWSRLGRLSSGVSCFTHGGLWCLLPTCGLVTSSDDGGHAKRARCRRQTLRGYAPASGPPKPAPRPRTATTGDILGTPSCNTEWQHAVHREKLAPKGSLWQGAALVNVPLSSHRSTCTA
jgi:hypothetical protein